MPGIPLCGAEWGEGMGTIEGNREEATRGELDVWVFLNTLYFGAVLPVPGTDMSLLTRGPRSAHIPLCPGPFMAPLSSGSCGTSPGWAHPMTALREESRSFRPVGVPAASRLLPADAGPGLLAGGAGRAPRSPGLGCGRAALPLQAARRVHPAPWLRLPPWPAFPCTWALSP